MTLAIVLLTATVWADDGRVFTGHQSLVSHLAFSPDSRLLASSSCDETIKLWNVATGEVLHTLAGHQGCVWGVAFTPDGDRLASAGWDGTIRIWDVKDGRALRTLVVEKSRVKGVAFAPDGNVLASVSSGPAGLQLWNTRTWALSGPSLSAATMFPSVAWDAAGRRLCSSTLFGPSLWTRDRDSGAFDPESTLNDRDRDCLALHPNGRRLATPAKGWTIAIREIETGKVLTTLAGHTESIRCIAYSADGTRLVSGSEDDSVRLWDLDQARELATWTGHTDDVWTVALSPDGRHAASGGQDVTIRLWPLPAAKPTPK